MSVYDIHDEMGLCKDNLGDQMIRVHWWFRSWNKEGFALTPGRNSGIHHLSPVSEHSGTDWVQCRSVRSSVAQ